MVNGETFITDLGNAGEAGAESKICRYAVWGPGNDMAGHRIIEVGNSLAKLQEKYRVSDEMVMRMT